MALTISTDLTAITTAEAAETTWWASIGSGGASVQETDFSFQGSASRSRSVSGAAASKGMSVDITVAASVLDFSPAGAQEDMLVYFQIATFSPGLLDALSAAPGMVIRIGSGADPSTDWWEWDIQYSDLLAQQGDTFFVNYALDIRAPFSRSAGAGGLNPAACRWFGAAIDTNATAKGQNLGIDRISYGFGEIIVSGTATNETSGFQEMITWDYGTKANRWGLLIDTPAGALCKGKIVIGDDVGTAATAFTGQDTTIAWAPTWYYDTNGGGGVGVVRPTVGYDSSGNWTGRKSDGTAYYGIEFRGNGTGNTNVTFGAAVGTTTGRSGPTFIGSKQIPTEFVGDDGAVENVAIYGTTFVDFRKLDFSANASTDLIYSSTFKSCGSLDIGPAKGKNNNWITGIGGAYKFLEYFTNFAATGAEQLSTANPITEWTDSLNGTDWSVPSASSGYVELLGGTTRANLTILDDDKMGSDDHYADCIIRFPAAGAGQGTLGPVIACHLTVDDYFWMEVDLVNDQVELFRVNTGTATSIAGPTAFTMDEDEDYQVLLRRSGTTINGFISGNSVASGIHTTKLSATDSAHTGTAQRLVGLRGDALAGQTGATGERPRVRLFGAGPITDNLGSIIFPDTTVWDVTNSNFINCSRAFGFDSEGSGDTYTITNISLSGNLVDAHNDSGGAVIGNISGGTLAVSIENTGSSTSTFNVSVPISIEGLTEGSRGVMIGNGGAEDGVELLGGYANSSGIISGSFTGATPQNVFVKARNAGLVAAVIEEENGVAFTDYTNDARDKTGSNDVNLLPATQSVNDALYVGGKTKFDEAEFNITTAGTTYTGSWQYYNGSWVSLTVTDGTSGFQTAGWNKVTFTKPSDWSTTTINGQGPFYYIRYLVSAGTGTRPQAEEVSIHGTTKYLPFNSTGSILANTGLTSTAVWIEDPINND